MSKRVFLVVLSSLGSHITIAQSENALASKCPTKPNLENVACVNGFAAVMPLPFSRPTSLEGSYNPQDRFSNTTVSDPSFSLITDALFVVFNEDRGLDILGSSPVIESVFQVEESVHEAPVYVPELNAIITSTLEQQVLFQTIINLNTTPPSMSQFSPNTPIYGVNGGRYFNGTVYWAVAGGDVVINGTSIQQAPGIFALNPTTRDVKPILNNYFGQRFNGPDDLVIDSAGDIFFTDPWYGVKLNLTQSQPVLHQQTYRFRPSTGAVSVIEAEIGIPNGITLSPDESTMYITDTSVTNFTNADPNTIPRYTWGATAAKSVYAFDTVNSPAGKYLTNKRPIWYPEEFGDDGFHVAANGFLVGAAGFGVDVLSPWGELTIRIQTDFIVNNVQFAGKGLDELWLFGVGRIERVRWNLRGMNGAKS